MNAREQVAAWRDEARRDQSLGGQAREGAFNRVLTLLTPHPLPVHHRHDPDGIEEYAADEAAERQWEAQQAQAHAASGMGDTPDGSES